MTIVSFTPVLRARRSHPAPFTPASYSAHCCLVTVSLSELPPIHERGATARLGHSAALRMDMGCSYPLMMNIIMPLRPPEFLMAATSSLVGQRQGTSQA